MRREPRRDRQARACKAGADGRYGASVAAPVWSRWVFRRTRRNANPALEFALHGDAVARRQEVEQPGPDARDEPGAEEDGADRLARLGRGREVVDGGLRMRA